MVTWFNKDSSLKNEKENLTIISWFGLYGVNLLHFYDIIEG